MKNGASLFYRHVARFLAQHSLNQCPAVVVGVSGGVDSMLLLHWAHWYWRAGHLSSLRVIFIHHHTRAAQDAELRLVQRQTRTLGMPFEALHLDREQGTNREAFWRGERRKLFFSSLRRNEELWLAHHLDDSWEWAQLSAARSSEPLAALGIPLRSGRIWHPFLCVTKEQIYREARRRNIPWLEDPTNQSLRQARSFWRYFMAPSIKKQHPQFLRHYARRSQELAERLGVALVSHSQVHSTLGPQGELFWSPPSRQQLLASIKRFSATTRGTLTQEVEKVLRAHRNGKHGPFRLSGGVRVFLLGDWLLVVGAAFSFSAEALAAPNFGDYSRQDFLRLVELSAQSDLHFAPFWCALDRGRPRRVYDALRGKHLETSHVLMNAQKLLKQWRDPQQILRLGPMWPLPSAAARD